MKTKTSYVAKVSGPDGRIDYTDAENAVWAELMVRQRAAVEGRACSEYLTALDRLALPMDRIPQCEEVSATLRAATGWEVVPVAALIGFDEFFRLLAARKFPAASFIRRRDELDYLPEPDIFHEVVGHCPLLLDPRFGEFTHAFGRAGVFASKADRVMLARLYWFTVEFGLIKPPSGELRAYGAGIVSSVNEARYALESTLPRRERFSPLPALRTSYRINALQKTYFVIESFNELVELARRDLSALVKLAQSLVSHSACETT